VADLLQEPANSSLVNKLVVEAVNRFESPPDVKVLQVFQITLQALNLQLKIDFLAQE